MPDTKEMFLDATSVEERAQRLGALRDALQKSIDRHDAGTDGFISAKEAKAAGTERVGIVKGAGPGQADKAVKLARLAERYNASQGENSLLKGLAPDQMNAVQEELAALRELAGELGKDLTTTSPGNLHPYDLEAPAKILVPRFTPLRNQIARQRGQGTAREYRRILGYTNTGMGGISDQTPFFSSESDSGTPAFGSLTLRRGQKISYAMDIHTANYMEMSLSDLVTWKAQFANLGFEDTRQLSQMALLWSHLLGEEKALLWGRGASGSGYSGPVSAPAGSVVASGSGATIPAATYGVKITANSSGGVAPAQTAPVTLSAALVVTLGQNIVVTLTSEPVGGLNYSLYVGPAGSETLQGVFIPNDATGTKITLSALVAGGAAFPSGPNADSSSNANAYDGYLTVLSNPANAGYFARMNALYPGKSIFTTGGTNIGDQPFQDAFAGLYANVYADPEELWVAAPQRRQITDFMRSATNGAAAYRITLDMNAESNMVVGGMATGIVNESSPTSRIVDLRVHPYMPAGAAFINSRTLPIPDSNIGETAVVTAVQDYMSVDWPQIQFTYDMSTYWFGTMIHYAPKWSAALLGLQ
jgi:hypothetical protein